MPSDVITLACLANELNNALKGARIDKIYQPEEDEVTFSVYTATGNKTLVFSACPNLPRLHFTTLKKENPINAPGFCMLLRKHLTSARIESVKLFGYDRNICFKINGKNEMADDTVFYLYMELMGRYSNLILTNETGKIMDVLRRVPLDMSHTRKLLPSLTYSPAEQTKISVLDTERARHVLSSTGASFDEIMKNCSGFAKETLEELLLLTEGSISFADDFLNLVNEFITNPTPCATTDENGSPIDFYSRPYKSVNKPVLEAGSLSNAIDLCISEQDRSSRIKAKSKRFLSLIKHAVSRTEKKLSANLNKLKDCEKAEDLKIKGEILTANLYRIPKGADSVTFPNFYDENNADIKIVLDPTKSPSHNAQDFFKRYTKLKRTKDTVVKMVAENRETLDYLKGLLFDISACKYESDLRDVEQNLLSFGLITENKGKKAKPQKTGLPTKYLFNDVEILVGRNNLQNDMITFEIGKKNEIWLHVKGYHGSHVLIKSSDPSPELLTFGAELAGFHSEAKGADKVDVDYTILKNVRRSPLKRAGLVVYTDFKTICIKPNEHKNLIADKN